MGLSEKQSGSPWWIKNSFHPGTQQSTPGHQPTDVKMDKATGVTGHRGAPFPNKRTRELGWCCGLNCAPLKFLCGSPSPQHDGIWRWGLREVLGLDEIMRVGTPRWDSCSSKKPAGFPRPVSTLHMWGHSSKKTAVSKLGKRSSPVCGQLDLGLPSF